MATQVELERSLEAAFSQYVQQFSYAEAVQAVGRLLSQWAAQPLQEVQDKPLSPGTVAIPPLNGRPQKDSPPKDQVQLIKAAGRPGNKWSGHWRRAVEAVSRVQDPWAVRNLHLLPMEHCIRHRYNPHKRHWVTDDVLVKIEGRPFAAGAMRECFALKKLSTFSANVFHDWRKAQNCVAKRYKKRVESGVYFMDVLVQQDAKLMGEAYNKTDPPKQVDLLQAAILEFPDRHDLPLMCVEQLIEGDYVKYNSNSGFVKGDDLLRYTPQAFSHFSWDWSKGTKICVDIQGVGDLYTDPQIHTLDGEGYGDGNLGMRGMALFFRTHQCNPLCARLHLKPFARCSPDVKAQGYISDSSTRSLCKGTTSRTLARFTSSMKARVREQQAPSQAPEPLTEKQLLEMLSHVPREESSEALIHCEISRVYAEVVLLPELRPEEDPADALKGGIFHLHVAAAQGCVQALVMLARIHSGQTELSSTAFTHMVKVGVQQGEIALFPAVAWRAAVLAAERGVAGAAAAVAHSYANTQGLGDGVLESPNADLAVSWYRSALEQHEELLRQQEVQAALEEGEAAAGGGAADSGLPAMYLGDLRTGAVSPIPEASEEGSAAGSKPSSAVSTPRHGNTLSRQMTETSGEGMSLVTATAAPQRQIPSTSFLLTLRQACEEEAAGLPYATVQPYELHAALGALLLSGGPGLEADPAAAAVHYNDAAEQASSLGKGKLAQKYYELAAQAESM